MHPILFSVHGFNFYTHGVLAVLGIIAGTSCLYFLAKKEKFDLTFLFDNVVYMILFGIIGARITYFFLYREQFSSLKEILFLWEGGMVSYGGFLLGGLGIALLLKYQKQPVVKWLDILGIAFPLGQVFGRIGNIFAGEYSGLPTGSKLNFDGLVPVTLYESVLCLVIFGVLFVLYKRFGTKKDGLFFSLSIILYGLGRFIIDFWRDEKSLFLHISLGQSVSLLICAAGLAFLFTQVIKISKKMQRA